jgi:Fungal specific transcription factor domain
MPAASNPTQGFVFVEGRKRGNYERKVRSYVSRKIWKEKRLVQVRKSQRSSPIPLFNPNAPPQNLPTSSAEPSEAHTGAQRRQAHNTEWSVVDAQPLATDLIRRASENARAAKQNDLLLTAAERSLIHLDPFDTLPCKLDRSGQDLAHRAKNLFLHSSPSWASVQFTESVSLRLAYMHRASFYSMLAAASSYLDSAMGRGVSVQTLRWTSESTSCVKRTLSSPETRNADEALTGVLSLLAVDRILEGGGNSHIHSKALAHLFRLRGGIQSLHQSHTMDLFVSFILVTPVGRGQIAHLDYLMLDAEGTANLKEWKADVDLLILELQNLHTWSRAMHWEDGGGRTALLAEIVAFLPHPKDSVKADQWIFIMCYLAVTLWDYRHHPIECENLLRELSRQCKQLGKAFNLADVVWLLVRGLDSARHRKWQVIRMIKVLHRLSKGLQSTVARFLCKIVDPRYAHDASINRKVLESICEEAFRGLPVTESELSRWKSTGITEWAADSSEKT